MAKAPPTPPASRSGKGPGGEPKPKRDAKLRERTKEPPENPDLQDQEANTKQNTTHPGSRSGR